MASVIRNTVRGTLLVLLSSVSAAQASLVAHYRLDEAAGTSCLDSSGNGIDGMYMNGISLGLSGATASTGTAIELDETAMGHAVITNALPLDQLQLDFALSVWIHPFEAGQDNGVMRIFGNDDSAWSFARGNGGLTYTTRFIQDYIQPANVPLNAWTHVGIVVHTNADCTFYLDGQSLGTVPANNPGGTPMSPNPNWYIGTLNNGVEFWEGLLDDLQLYSGTVTDADMSFLFANPGSTIPTTVGASYCTTNPNSSGGPAAISGDGSASVAANDLTLIASPVPVGEPGIFYYGPDEISVPFGNGIRCVGGSGGSIERLFPFAVGDAANTMSYTVDNTAPAHAPQLGTVGTTWKFQAWFRDPSAGGSAFNLSNGLSVTLEP